MRVLKILLVILFVCVFICSCDNLHIITGESDNLTVMEYKLVKPTEQELENLINELSDPLGMHQNDYNCETDNTYEHMFLSNDLLYVYPDNERSVIKYIAKPLNYYYTKYPSSPCWFLNFYEDDPLLKFGEIPKECYNDDGFVDGGIAEEYYKSKNTARIDMTLGYNKYSGPYIDWLVEGVWNGKINHEDCFEFESTRTKLYYHDRYYYTAIICGDKGGPGVWTVLDNVSITKIDDYRYEIFYDVDRYEDEFCGKGKAIVGLKEASNGFRFWSIFSIDYTERES